MIISKAYVERIGSNKGADTFVKMRGRNDCKNIVAPIGYLGYMTSSEVHVLSPNTDLLTSESNLALTRWYLSERNEPKRDPMGRLWSPRDFNI